MSVITVEHRMAPPPAAAERTAPRPMPGGIAFSAILHLAIFALILLGLPSLFRPPPPTDMPIAVELVTIAPESGNAVEFIRRAVASGHVPHAYLVTAGIERIEARPKVHSMPLLVGSGCTRRPLFDVLDQPNCAHV